MQIFNSFNEIPFEKNTVLTVGTFDGVHKGHLKIIRRLLEIANNENQRDLIVTFEPHPRIALNDGPKPPVQLLTSIDERLHFFENEGVSNTLIIPFDYEFSRTPPDVFVKELLSKKAGFRKILIGYDHFFGRDRQGGIELLQNMSKELDFEVERIEALTEHETIVSSTKVRKAIAETNIELAAEMMGHDYLISGEVVVGDMRGRKLGIPTANIEIKDPNKLIPGNGVYIVYSTIGGVKHYGMCNIGFRPTFTYGKKRTIEVHFLDMNPNANLYGRTLNIYFWRFIRNERKFDGKEEFLEQIEKDKKLTMEMIEKFSG